MTNFSISGRRIGPNLPVYVIAELSANHNQQFEQAVGLVKAAKEAGADAIKLQTYTPDTITIRCDTEYFQLTGGTLWDGRTLHDLYGQAYMPWDWQPRLKAIAEQLGLDLFSSPFDGTAVEFLENTKVPAYKIASFEIVDIPLVRRIAHTGKPVIMSTGMATLAEIEEAVRTIRDEGNDNIALLKCTSAYPAPTEEMNLRTIPHLSKTFGTPVGLSDHTLGIAVSVAAVALGATIIEKHLTLSRSDPGPDSPFSLEPQEFKEMVAAVRATESALGSVQYGPSAAERSSTVFRRSLFVVDNMRAGEVFSERNIRSIRPGHGLHTRFLEQVLGQHASCDIKRGTPLDWALISERRAEGQANAASGS